jgi:Uncharacterised conserved protein
MLHLSLSSPLILTTEQKEGFTSSIKDAIRKTLTNPFDVKFTDVEWVANTPKTRWFLVLRVQEAADIAQNKLKTILGACNGIAAEFGLPLLYAKKKQREYGDAPEEGAIATKRARTLKTKNGQQINAKTLFGTTTSDSGASVATEKGSGAVSSTSSTLHFADRDLPPQPQFVPPINRPPDDSFHVSIGWRLQAPSKESENWLKSAEGKSLCREYFDNLRINFDTVKLKVGNIVTNVPLYSSERRSRRRTKVDDGDSEGEGLMGES